jgi:hypothetical protein
MDSGFLGRYDDYAVVITSSAVFARLVVARFIACTAQSVAVVTS